MSAAMMPLEHDIRRRIAAAGPMPISQYMALCLADPRHGYYVTRDPLGARGDFTTAPEVSQMFGELIGLWMASVWQQMGSPEHIRIVELGPGRGTMMKDALRAAKVVPGFVDAAVLHLVEISPVLQAAQEQTLAATNIGIYWHASLNDVPQGPAVIVANEFFDALPVDQAVKMADGWHRRGVIIGADDMLAYDVSPEPLTRFEATLPPTVRAASDGDIFEWRSDIPAMEIGRRIADARGAALMIDYGHVESGVGATLQAVRDHLFEDPLATPGEADLTAHVDFEALARTLSTMGTTVHGPIEQATFLRRLGIETRAARLKANAGPDVAYLIDVALARLAGVGRTGMGSLFKVLACTHPSLPPPPAFEV
jgi:SAM-dependent MidA family methyltransferase